MVEEAIEDTPDEERTALPHASVTGLGATERACYEFVNGIGSKAARWFEISIYLLIGVTGAPIQCDPLHASIFLSTTSILFSDDWNCANS